LVKRYGALYLEAASFDNLLTAYHDAAKGKRAQSKVAAFEFDLERNLFSLQAELWAKAYKPEGYCSFLIHDPKRRLVSAAPFRDRVVHHALCNVIQPIFERTFIGDSYANRVGKGTHAALDCAQKDARSYRYVLKCDVRKYFPSIDHAILRAILARKIADDDVLWLVDQILDSGAGILDEEYEMVYFPGDDLFAVQRPRGLPIGNLTSQLWANVYLNELDQFVKRELHCKAYVRYVDDFLLFFDSKRQLWMWKAAVVDFLRGLRLTLHARESTVFPVSVGIPFLGFRIYPTHRRLRRRNGVAFARRFLKARAAVAKGKLPLAKLHEHVRGWVAHVRHGSTFGLRRSLFRVPIRLPKPR
jgi:retron-type reverse transcriptase